MSKQDLTWGEGKKVQEWWTVWTCQCGWIKEMQKLCAEKKRVFISGDLDSYWKLCEKMWFLQKMQIQSLVLYYYPFFLLKSYQAINYCITDCSLKLVCLGGGRVKLCPAGVLTLNLYTQTHTYTPSSIWLTDVFEISSVSTGNCVYVCVCVCKRETERVAEREGLHWFDKLAD